MAVIYERRRTWEADLILFIERWYRCLQAGAALVYLAVHHLHAAPQHYRLTAIGVASGYVVCALALAAWRRWSAGYAKQRWRLVRYLIDCGFTLALVILDGGTDSPLFALMVIPVFLAVYRFHGSYGITLVVFAGVLGYLDACLYAWHRLEAPFHPVRFLTQAFILGFAGYLNRHSKLFLKFRLERVSEAGKETLKGPLDRVKLDALAHRLKETMGSQVCLLFSRKGDKGNYRLMAASVPQEDQGPSGKAPLELTTGWENNMNMRETGAWRFRQRKGELGRRFVENVERRFLQSGAGSIGPRLAGIQSGLLTHVQAPEDTQVAVLLLNRFVEPAVEMAGGAVGTVEYFKEEDEYLLQLCASAALVRTWSQAAADSFEGILQTGIADDLSILDPDGTIRYINDVKKRFFGITKDEAVGRKCWSVFHGYNDPSDGPPCNRCGTLPVAQPGGPKENEWSAWFVHLKTDHPHETRIHATRVTDSLGRTRVAECVTDITAERRHERLRSFLTAVQTRPVLPDEEEENRAVADLVLALMSDLFWRRARLYEWDAKRRTFACLGSTGHRPDIAYREFEFDVRRPAQKPSDDCVSPLWIDRPEIGTVPKLIALETLKGNPHFQAHLARINREYGRRTRTHGATKQDGPAPPYEIFYVPEYPQVSDAVDMTGLLCKMEIPLIVGGTFVGKISLDTLDEKTGKRPFFFDLGDILLARECGGLLGHVLQLSRRDQALELLRGYVAGRHHRILQPVQNVMDILEWLRTTPTASEADRQRKLTEAMDNLNFITISVRGTEIERIPKEAYEFQACDVLQDVLTPLVESVGRHWGEAKQVTIRFEAPTSMRPVRADAGMLRVLFWNLLLNAVQYSDKGRTVGVRIEDAGREVRVHVSNTGLPIFEKDMRRLFRPFSRGTNAHKYNVTGLGFGLYAAATIAENLNGKIEISSLANPTTFTVVLPKEPPTTNKGASHGQKADTPG